MDKKFKLFEEFRSKQVNEAELIKDPKSLTLSEKDFDSSYKGLTKFREVLLDVLLNDNPDVASIRAKMETIYKEVTLQWPKIKKFYELQKEYLEKAAVEAPPEDIKPETTTPAASAPVATPSADSEEIKPE